MTNRIFLSLIVLASLQGCSSSSTNNQQGTDAGDDDASQPADDASTPEAAADAGIDSPPLFVDGSIPEGGTPATPGMVACGSTSCATATDYCCVSQTGGGAAPTCTATSTANGCANGVRQVCDDANDCAAGQQCCLILDQGPFAITTCSDDCINASAAYQVCHVNGECQIGSACKEYNCGAAGNWEFCATSTPSECH